MLLLGRVLQEMPAEREAGEGMADVSQLGLGCCPLSYARRGRDLIERGVTVMKSFSLFAAICAVALSAEATKAANAATITETINFTAGDFLFGDAPVDPVANHV